MKKTRKHLDSSIQPETGWRVIPQNSLFEANVNGMIRNRKNKKLIKGTMTRKYHPKFTAHEIVYFLQPKKTTYSRAHLIASTFPELISQSRGDIRTGNVCFKDGDRTNCHVDNMFIGAGTVRTRIYKLNNSYLTRKDVESYLKELTGHSTVLIHIETMFNEDMDMKVVKNKFVLYKDNNTFQIFGLEDRGMVEFNLDIKKIKIGGNK